jgi:hypothetical protein
MCSIAIPRICSLPRDPLPRYTLWASPMVLSMWHSKIFFTSKFSYLLFFTTLPIKLKLGQQIGGRLLIANHMHQLLQWVTQKHGAPVKSYLLHSFQQVQSVAAPFASHGKLSIILKPKPFSWAKPACFHFSSSNFIVQDHILSTTGDALSTLVVLAQIIIIIIFKCWKFT